MFAYNDKITLVGVNAVNKDGQIMDFIVPFPINYYISIPTDLVQMSIFEYHEGHELFGRESIRLFVGKITSFRQLCEVRGEEFSIRNSIFRTIQTGDDELCYFDSESGVHTIFGKVEKGDIVVDNIDELKQVLFDISDNFQNIQDSICKIRNYGNERGKKIKTKKKADKKE